MTETSACYSLSRCPAEGARRCPGCAAKPNATPRVTLAEDAVMAMAMSVSFATILIALAFWLT